MGGCREAGAPEVSRPRPCWGSRVSGGDTLPSGPNPTRLRLKLYILRIHGQDGAMAAAMLLPPPILLLGAMPPATAEVARSNWLGNYTQSWGAEKTVVIAGSSDNTVLAFNRVQPWSPATGVVNGSAIRMTFGGHELRGRLHPSGFIVWENDSRWTKEDSVAFKMMATSALKAAMASKAKPPSATAKGGPPADDESYESYSCASLPRQSLVCRLPTLTAFFCVADEGDASSYSYAEPNAEGDGSYSYSYESYESCARSSCACQSHACEACTASIPRRLLLRR